MTERKNTVVCIFDPASPRISAMEVHEWIFAVLKVKEQTVQMIQIDGARRRVYIKVATQEEVFNILDASNGSAEYKHISGEISHVKIELAGLGTRKVRIANLPPELPNSTVRIAMGPYGVVQSISDEQWAAHYRYAVSNGVRIVQMTLNKHLPSHMTIAGYRALVAYEGQPQTCYGCSATDHVYQECPKRKNTPRRQEERTGPVWNVPNSTDKECGGRVEHETTMSDHTAAAVPTNPESVPETLGMTANSTIGTESRRKDEAEAPGAVPPDQQEPRKGQVVEPGKRWADEISEEEQNLTTMVRTEDVHPMQETAWPRLVTKPYPGSGDRPPPATTKPQVTPNQGPIRKPTGKADTSMEIMMTERPDAELRGKKQRLTKSNEQLPERKRTRNKAPPQGQASQ